MSARDIAMRAAGWIADHAILSIVASIVLAAALSFGIPLLKFRTGQDTLLDPSSKIAQDNTRFQSQFGGDPMLVLLETADASDIRLLFSPSNREQLQRAEAELNATGNYQNIISPLTVVEFAQKTIEQRLISEPQKLAGDEAAAEADARAASAARGETPAQQDAAAAAARDRVDAAFHAEFDADGHRFTSIEGPHTLDNPQFLEFVLFGADGKVRSDFAGIFPDDRHALMIVRARGNLSIDEGAQVAANTKTIMGRYHFDGVDAKVTGPPLLIKEINDKMKSSLVVMAIFAVGIMIVVLSVIFRARWRLLSLPAVLIGCVAAFGLMGFTRIPLTMVTISGLPILMGLGVDFAIQIHSRIEEETYRTDSARAGLEAAFARLGPALALALVAGCIGFIVLRLSDVPMVQDFGAMLAVGAVIIFITTVLLISGVVYLRERERLGAKAETQRRFEVERIIGGITSQTVGRLAPIAAVATIVAVAGVYVSGKIPTQTDPERFVPSNSSVLNDLHEVRDVSGSTNELNLLIETNGDRRATEQDVLDWMGSFEQRQLQEHAAELGQSNSVASFARSVTGSAPTTASAEETLASSPPALRDAVISQDGRTASMTFALRGTRSLDEEKTLTQSIVDDAHAPAGVQVAPAGLAVVGTAAVDAVSHNRELMSLAAVIAILLALLVFYRNPVKAVAPLLPVILALGASAMLLYFTGVEYSPLTSISGPLIIAMGTEFNILLMSRYFEERARGLSPRAAMAAASLRIGRAITSSGLTVMGGFAVLAFSDFPLLTNFGTVTALNIGLSLLSTLILLPPLLVWADGDRGYVGVPVEAAAPRAARE